MIRKLMILAISMLLMIQLSTGVEGDTGPDPNYLTSLTAMGETLDSFLDVVNVTMVVEEKTAFGTGSFLITNPSDEWENITLVFDPGADTFDMEVKIGGKTLEFEYVEYDNFYGERWYVYGIRFNISIPPNNSSIADLTWKYDVDQDYHKNFFDYKNRRVEYLIIGMIGWSRPISEISVRFIMDKELYPNPAKYSSELTTEFEDNNAIYEYNKKNFSDDRLLLQIVFIDYDSSFNPVLYDFQLFIIMGFVLLGVGGIAFYIYRENKKCNEKEDHPDENSEEEYEKLYCPKCDQIYETPFIPETCVYCKTKIKQEDS